MHNAAAPLLHFKFCAVEKKEVEMLFWLSAFSQGFPMTAFVTALGRQGI